MKYEAMIGEIGDVRRTSLSFKNDKRVNLLSLVWIIETAPEGRRIGHTRYNYWSRLASEKIKSLSPAGKLAGHRQEIRLRPKGLI